MIFYLIFLIGCSFFILLQEKILQHSIYEPKYTQDQLKTISSFIRSHDNLNDIDIQKLGISESFMENNVIIKKAPTQYIPFDSIFIYSKYYSLQNSDKNFLTFFDYEHEIYINDIKLSNYEIKYYSQFIPIHTNYKKSLTMQIIKNVNSKVQNYII